MDKENYIASVLMGNANVDDLPIALVLFLAVEIEKLSQEGQITEEQKVSFQKYIKNFEKEFAGNTSAKNAESAFWLGVNYGAITGESAHYNNAMLENIEKKKYGKCVA